MKENMLDMLSCPECNRKIILKSASEESNDRIKEGILVCSTCKSEFPVKDYILRFVPHENYAQSFGFQWNKHARAQIDKFCRQPVSRERFFRVTEWPENLEGQMILEVGCGAGRFTQVAIETGADVYSFDYSNAVEANIANNGLQANLNLFQADIYHIPLKRASFDKIFCFGVLQHCPNPKKAFLSLIPYLKPGGEVVIDIYDLTLRAFLNPKYWLRPFTKRLPPEKLYKLLQKVVPKVFPIKMWVTEKVPFGKYPAFFIPIAYHKGFIPNIDKFSYDQLLEWSILDTFDKYAPRYDKPQRITTIKKWFLRTGLTNVSVKYGPNGIVAKGVKSK